MYPRCCDQTLGSCTFPSAGRFLLSWGCFYRGQILGTGPILFSGSGRSTVQFTYFTPAGMRATLRRFIPFQSPITIEKRAWHSWIPTRTQGRLPTTENLCPSGQPPLPHGSCVGPLQCAEYSDPFSSVTIKTKVLPKVQLNSALLIEATPHHCFDSK